MSESEGGGMDFTLLGSLEKESDIASGVEAMLNSLPSTITLTGVSTTDGELTIDSKPGQGTQIRASWRAD